MRKKMVVANWKMNTSIADGTLLAKQVSFLHKGIKGDCEVVLVPPFTHLSEVSKVLKEEKSTIKLGAQNCASKNWGALTGEVSALMIKELGSKYIIVGHSERRVHFGEDHPLLLDKCKIAIDSGLNVIYCVGESLEEREEKRHFEVISTQIKEVLYKLSAGEIANIVVAYEPVWAIGTGKSATPDQAEEMHAYIRRVVAEKFPRMVESLTILYGGSCNPSNAEQFFSKENIDGGLIGGASLDPKSFAAIIEAC